MVHTHHFPRQKDNHLACCGRPVGSLWCVCSIGSQTVLPTQQFSTSHWLSVTHTMYPVQCLDTIFLRRSMDMDSHLFDRHDPLPARQEELRFMVSCVCLGYPCSSLLRRSITTLLQYKQL
uniref:Uncharacterized protein n=1 Tax=Cacopsylla melanoneura TaxID=428564 RepID=A0A8D8PUL2_9HEMI